MLRVDVEFLHRTQRSSATDLALTGSGVLDGEWPPTPARLFSAFVAADGTRDRCTLKGSDAALALLMGTPLILGDPECAQSAIISRFVPVNANQKGTVQNYPAREAQAVRPGTRVSLRTPHVSFVWPLCSPTRAELESLRYRAARIPYLGCADSPVRVRVVAWPGGSWSGEAAEGWVPTPDGAAGAMALGVADEGFLERLDLAFDEFTAGSHRQRSWIATPKAWYRRTDGKLREPRPTALWIRFGSRASGRRVVAVAETMRAAVMSKYQELVGPAVALPTVLTGHDPDPQGGFEVCRWLPLPYSGSEHADGRLLGACIWVPPGTDPAVVALIRLALARVSRLSRSDGINLEVLPFDERPPGRQELPWSLNPDRWSRPSRRWVSVTPVVYERRVKRLALTDLAQWCAFAGLPAPIAFGEQRVGFVPGAVALHPSEAFRGPHYRRPYAHMWLEFADPVPGPVALGRGRHFGLGLMAPIDWEVAQ